MTDSELRYLQNNLNTLGKVFFSNGSFKCDDFESLQAARNRLGGFCADTVRLTQLLVDAVRVGSQGRGGTGRGFPFGFITKTECILEHVEALLQDREDGFTTQLLLTNNINPDFEEMSLDVQYLRLHKVG